MTEAMGNVEFEIFRAILAGYNEHEGWDYWKYATSLNIPGFGKVTVLKREGSVGDGAPAIIVFALDDGGDIKYFRKAGYTDSYDYDITWHGEFRQVVPVEKLVYDYV